MVVHLHSFQFLSTENRIRFLHRESIRLHDNRRLFGFEYLVEYLSSGAEEAFELDMAIRSEFLGGKCYDAGLLGELEAIVGNWHLLALALDGDVPTGEVGGIAHSKLRALIPDLAAAVRPSFEMNEKIDAICDAAIVEYEEGDTIAGLVD